MARSFVARRKTCANRTAKVASDVDALGTYLRNLYPRDTAANVAADIGVAERTIDNWLAGAAAPRLTHFLRLVEAYGPTVIAATYPGAPRWLDDAVRAEQRRELEQQAAEIAARLEAMP